MNDEKSSLTSDSSLGSYRCITFDSVELNKYGVKVDTMNDRLRILNHPEGIFNERGWKVGVSFNS